MLDILSEVVDLQKYTQKYQILFRHSMPSYFIMKLIANTLQIK